VLTGIAGHPVTGTFVLIAVGGPVNFVIHDPNVKVTVSPASGSLPSAGSFVKVTVTVRSLVALGVRLTVDPRNRIVTVLFNITA
jgi:hypothetical protein